MAPSGLLWSVIAEFAGTSGVFRPPP